MNRRDTITTGHVFIAVSLDGYVARRDHQIDWLMKQQTQDDADRSYEEFISGIDGIVMGSGSYKTVAAFDEWPYQIPVVVLSKSLSQSDIPDELSGKVRVTDLEPRELMESLSKEGWSRAYIDGGRLVQSFVRLGLVQDFALTTIPILIGEGISLFGPLDEDIDLELIDVKALKSGLVTTRYSVGKKNT